MSTPPRYFQSSIPYHIYNRGNRKEEIFRSYKDYRRFVKRLKEYKEQFKIELLCYCLMPNHFHLLALQKDPEAITKFMLRLCTSYVKYFNIKYELVGRLFQERFRAKIVETDEYLLHLSRYIHLNPISDDLQDLKYLSSTPGVERESTRERLQNYMWSSYSEYYTQKNNLCHTQVILSYFSKTNPQLSYSSFVESGIRDDEISLLQEFI